MVSLTIDGRAVSVPEGSTILDAARQVGIHIPTLCWLEKVSPTGACRVCVVDVEGVARPMTACNTPIKEGIVVTTSNEKLEAIRKQVMELMLVNHPLDCPVCDAAGECDLQDTCYSFGVAKPEYQAHLNRKQIRYDWPLIESDPNRCILCEKCVKVDHEIVRSDVIEVVNRGEETIIDTHDGKPLTCDFCGNCVGACPVGALIDKPFKFRGRPWTYTVTRSTCGYCPVGCEIDYHARNGRVDRVTTKDETFCRGNLCINGRYGFDYINSGMRLITPLVAGKKSDWNGAMALTAGRLKEIVAAHGPDAVAGLTSPRLTNEEQFLFQKLFRTALGSNNLDSEARFGFAPALQVIRRATGGGVTTMDRIDTAGAVFVIGSNLNAEATGYEYRAIKAATVNDAKLVLANVAGVKLRKIAHGQLHYRPGSEAYLANGIAKLVLAAGLEDKTTVAGIANLAEYNDTLARLSLATVVEKTGLSEETLREAATLLGGKKSVAVLFGSELLRSGTPGAVEAVVNLAILVGAVGKEQGGLFPLHEKINIRGLLDMGVAPDLLPGGSPAPAKGRDLWQIVEGIEQGVVKALYLIGVDPLVSFPEGGRIRKALEKLELLIVQDLFPTATAAIAHVVLPASSSAEKSGTFTTIDGRLQKVAKALSSPGDAREDWDILTELFDRITGRTVVAKPPQLLAEIRVAIPGYGDPVAGAKGPFSFVVAPVAEAPGAAGFTLLVGPILFHNGTTSTWSVTNREVSPTPYVEIQAGDAAKLGIADGGAIKLTTASGSLTGTARVTERLQPGLLFAPNHFPDFPVSGLLAGNATFVAVKVEKG